MKTLQICFAQNNLVNTFTMVNDEIKIVDIVTAAFNMLHDKMRASRFESKAAYTKRYEMLFIKDQAGNLVYDEQGQKQPLWAKNEDGSTKLNKAGEPVQAKQLIEVIQKRLDENKPIAVTIKVEQEDGSYTSIARDINVTLKHRSFEDQVQYVAEQVFLACIPVNTKLGTMIRRDYNDLTKLIANKDNGLGYADLLDGIAELEAESEFPVLV